MPNIDGIGTARVNDIIGAAAAAAAGVAVAVAVVEVIDDRLDLDDEEAMDFVKTGAIRPVLFELFVDDSRRSPINNSHIIYHWHSNIIE